MPFIGKMDYSFLNKDYPCKGCEHEENCKVECEKFIAWYCSPITKGKRSI